MNELSLKSIIFHNKKSSVISQKGWGVTQTYWIQRKFVGDYFQWQMNTFHTFSALVVFFYASSMVQYTWDWVKINYKSAIAMAVQQWSYMASQTLYKVQFIVGIGLLVYFLLAFFMALLTGQLERWQEMGWETGRTCSNGPQCRFEPWAAPARTGALCTGHTLYQLSHWGVPFGLSVRFVDIKKNRE